MEDGGVVLGDESHWLVLNAAAYASATNKQLADVLRYAATGRTDSRDGLVGRIDDAVRKANSDPRLVRDMEGFMTMEDNIRMHYQMLMSDEVQKAAEDGRSEGIAEGLAEGTAAERSRLGTLTKRMEGEGRTGELVAALADPALLDSLYAEFGL